MESSGAQVWEILGNGHWQGGIRSALARYRSSGDGRLILAGKGLSHAPSESRMRENLMSGSMRGGWRGAVALNQSPTLPS